MPHHARQALLTVGAVLGALSSIHGASYTFTTIDVPDALSVSAFGINDRGEVVGSHLDTSFRNHGFLWNEGVLTTIDFPGAIATVAAAINARGQIVSFYGDGTGVAHGFLSDTQHGFLCR
jgi:probable HAF family extracellular repeat protein